MSNKYCVIDGSKKISEDYSSITTGFDGVQTDMDGKIPKSTATAADQVLVSSGVGAWAVKTLAQIKAWLGLGSAAYTESTAYAPASHLADLVTDADGAHGLITEEGAFTPSLIGSTTPGTNVYSVQNGYYVRIGKLVMVTGQIVLASKGVAMAGTMKIAGLPFTSKVQTNGFASATIGFYEGLSGVTGNGLGGYIGPNANNIDLCIQLTTGVNSLTPANLTNSTNIIFTATYQI